MNSLERVTAAITGDAKDRTPFTGLFSLYGAKLTNCPLGSYYQSPTAYLQGQKAVMEQVAPDILFSPFILALEGEVFGSQLTDFNNNPPNIKKPVCTTPEQVINLTVPDYNKNPGLLYIRESLSLLKQEFGQNTIIASPTLTPAALPVMLMGLDCWLETLLFNQGKACDVLEFTSAYVLNWVNQLFDDGANCVVFPLVFCNPTLVTDEIISGVIKDYLIETFKKLNGPVILHHGGAPISAFIELLCDMPNVIGFVVDTLDDFDHVRKKIGNDYLLLGNIDIFQLKDNSEQEIASLVRNLLTKRQDDPKFILSTSGPDVHYNTPIKNINALKQAIELYG